MNIEIVSAGATHRGLVRERNEDAFFADDALGLYVIADGMGGHPDGDIASKTAVEAIHAFVREQKSTAARGLATLARDAVQAANTAIVSKNQGRPQAQQMGTTIAAVLINKSGDFAMASAGDSRCYRVEGGVHPRIDLMSRDDTVAAALVARGAPPELIRGVQQHTLTQAIGIAGHIEPHLATGAVHAGDALVLCTDGITGFMDENAFRGALMALHEAPGLLSDTLIRGALKGGGGDNATCVCLLARERP